MVVMSTHGRSGFRRWMLGSVADKVVRAAYQALAIDEQRGPFAPAVWWREPPG